jgi:hypothetical protein
MTVEIGTEIFVAVQAFIDTYDGLFLILKPFIRNTSPLPTSCVLLPRTPKNPPENNTQTKCSLMSLQYDVQSRLRLFLYGFIPYLMSA